MVIDESRHNNRSIWPKIVVTVLLLAVLYVGSFGPACWLVDRGYLAARPTSITYSPILRFLIHNDSWTAAPIVWYAEVGSSHNSHWTILRLYDAAGLIPFKIGVWPDDMRSHVPYRSDDIRF